MSNHRYPLRNRLRSKDLDSQYPIPGPINRQDQSDTVLRVSRKHESKKKHTVTGRKTEGPTTRHKVSENKFTENQDEGLSEEKNINKNPTKNLEAIGTHFMQGKDFCSALKMVEKDSKLEGTLKSTGGTPYQELDPKLAYHNADPWLFFIAVFNINSTQAIVLIDGESLKSFFTQDDEPCCSLVELEPYVIAGTKLGSDRVAIIFDEWEQRIHVYKVTPRLVKEPDIPTRKDYHGIAGLSSTTLVAYKPPTVDIIDTQRHILRSFNVSPPSGIPSMNPSNVHVTKDGLIIVADNRIMCMTQTGDYVFGWDFEIPDYRTTTASTCITSTGSGDILFADGYNCQRVVQISTSGEHVRDLLTFEDPDLHPADQIVSDMCVEGELLYIATKWKGVKVYKIS